MSFDHPDQQDHTTEEESQNKIYANPFWFKAAPGSQLQEKGNEQMGLRLAK